MIRMAELSVIGFLCFNTYSGDGRLPMKPTKYTLNLLSPQRSVVLKLRNIVPFQNNNSAGAELIILEFWYPIFYSHA